LYFIVNTLLCYYCYTVVECWTFRVHCIGFECCVKLDHSIFYDTLFLIRLYFALLAVMIINEVLLKSKLTVALDASYVVSSI